MAELTKMFHVNMPQSADEALLKVIHSGMVTQGPAVERFEGLLRAYLGSSRVLTVNSGTAALMLALRLAGVGPGDEVISTPMTCSATNEPIALSGARIRWADVHPRTGLIDPWDVQEKITHRTKAIMAVHWGGTPADMTLLCDIAAAHGLVVIEDAAHAFWAPPQRTHQRGDFTAYSFQAIKHITTIDGGALVCRLLQDYERGKKLRWFGIDRTKRSDFRLEEDIEECGYKFHMNDVAATLGIEQMGDIDEIVSVHRRNAAFYDSALPDFFEISAPGRSDSAYWLYTVLLPNSEMRRRFQIYMLGIGIETSQVHSRNDRFSCFKEFVDPDLPGLEQFSSRQVSIPVHSALKRPDLERIADHCRKFARSNALVAT